MTLNSRKLLWIALSVAVATGCTAHVYAPPSRMAALDGPSLVGEGKTEVSGQFGLGVQVLGSGYHAGGVQVRHGISEQVEVTGNASYFAVSGRRDGDLSPNAAEPDATYHPEEETWFLYAGRVGMKWSPPEVGGHVAIFSGIGGGYSDAGGFVSTDLGVSVGYNNAYVVPFAAVGGFISVPVGSKAIDISDNGKASVMQTAQFTYGGQGLVGLRGEIAVQEGQHVSWMLGATTTLLMDSEQRDGFWGGVVEVGYGF